MRGFERKGVLLQQARTQFERENTVDLVHVLLLESTLQSFTFSALLTKTVLDSLTMNALHCC